MTDERLGRPSGSEFERVMNCDGYLTLKRAAESQRVIPEGKGESNAASQGTLLHDANEAGDTTGLEYSEEEIVKEIRSREEELVRQWCVDFGIPFDGIKIEREVRFWFQDMCSAKLDVLVTYGEYGYYLDTKTGRLAVPPPVRNWQLRVGALCAKSSRQLSHVRTAIVNVYGKLMAPCDYPLEDLLQVGRMVTRRLLDSEGNDRTTAGEWCRYCPAIHICPSQREQISLVIRNRSLNWDLVDPDQKLPLYLAANMAIDAGQAIIDQIKADLKNGVECPGLLKKPDGQARFITDTNRALKVARDEYFQRIRGKFTDEITDSLMEKFNTDFLAMCSIGIGKLATLYRDQMGGTKNDAELFIATKCADFISASPRSGSVEVVK